MHDLACMAAYGQALDYIGRKTMDWPQAKRDALRHSLLWREGDAPLGAALARGDLAATKAACKTWWTAVLAFQGEEVAA